MPGVHTPVTQHLFTLEGNVLRTGGAKRLAKGTFTIVDVNKPTGGQGAAVVGDFAGVAPEAKLAMRVGKHNIPTVRTAANSLAYSSHVFSPKDLVSIKANAPRILKQEVDSLLIGYDGINNLSAINLAERQTTLIDIELKGDHIGYITGNCKFVFKMHFGREVGDTNQDVIEKAVARLKKETFPMGVPLTEVLDIKVVNSEGGELGGIPYVFSSLNVTDAGDSNALALVQNQYPAYLVERTARTGLNSTYSILHPQSVELADYVQTLATIVKGCENCPADYVSIGSGVVYSVRIEDDGVNVATTIDDLPGFVSGSVVRLGSVEGLGVYTVVVDNALTDAEIASFVGTAGIKSTAVITLIGDVRAVCSNDAEVEIAWVAGQTCYATVEQYKIQLADDDCDGSRLSQLQAAYPNLVIQAGVPTGAATQTVTVANDTDLVITIDGVEYETTDGGTTTQTAAAFVTAHAAAILAAHGVTVTSATNVITFAGQAVGFPNIVPTAQTLGSITYATTATAGGCQRVYSTQVITNLVCEECSDIFVQPYVSEAPEPFNFTNWEYIPTASSANAKMGIKLTSKKLIMYPTEISRDEIPFYETSTEIRVAGGYIEEQNMSFDPLFSDIFEVRRLSRKQDRDNLGYYLLGAEEASRAYFDGEVRHRNNQYAKAILGEESVLKFDAQYVSYEVTMHDSKYSQAIGGRSDIGHTYIIWAELGRHTALESYLNALAAKAGLPAVQALVL